jgi:hypothetical protein
MSTFLFSLRTIRFIFSTSFIFCLLFSLQAGAQTWDGGGDGTSWSDALNWNPNGVPGASANITLGTGLTVVADINATCASITFSGGGAASSLSIASGVTLIVTGNVSLVANANSNTAATISGLGTLSCLGNINIGQTSVVPNQNRTTNLISTVANCNVGGDIVLTARTTGARTNNPVFNLNSGTFTLDGQVRPVVQTFNSQTVTFSMLGGDASATLVLNNQDPWETDADFVQSSGWGNQSSGGANYSLLLNGTNATVIYNRSGNQTINRDRYSPTGGNVAVTYRNLYIAGSGVKTIPTNSSATINGTLSMRGTASLSKSPVYGSGSTLEYKGDIAQTTTSIEFLSGVAAPLNLIIDNPNGVELHTSRTLRNSAGALPNTIYLRSGVLNNSTFNVSISNASTIVRSGGSFSSVFPFPTTVNVTYAQHTSSITSSFEMPSDLNTLVNLLIDNTNGVILSGNTTVNGLLTLNAGKLTIPVGLTLDIASGNQISGTGFDNNKHIVTQTNLSGGIGYLRTGDFNDGRQFPIGNGTYYLPVSLFSSGTNNFNLAVFQGATKNGQPDGIPFGSKVNMVDAIWLINRNNGSAATDITLSWVDPLEGANIATLAGSSLAISRYDGSIWDNAVGVNGDNVLNVVTRNDVNDFSPFGITFLDEPLPVKFGNISAARSGQLVNVQWEAFNEENLAFYEIQKSYTGNAFSKASLIQSEVDSRSSFTYTWTDEKPGTGAVFYRIKAVDQNGKFQYSPIVKVAPENRGRYLNVYPNPVQINGRLNIEAGALPAGSYYIELIDMSGVRTFNRKLEHNGGSLTQNIELLKSLSKGTYVMKFSGENIKYTSTIVVQ